MAKSNTIDDQTFLVGGAVRDKLLGIEVYDKDWVVVGAEAKDLSNLGYEQVGKDFPVFINKKTGEEYALARTERKTAKGYQGFEFQTSKDISLEQDLARRDLTINAMAQSKLDSESTDNIIDPYNGQQDLKDGILRHVSDAFIEDPVRILRVARFAAKFNFTIAPETMTLMREMVNNGEVDALVPERVWAEMSKALSTDAPHIFIKVLRDSGALAKILPEVDNLFGIPQTEKYHPEIDTGIHTLMVLEHAAAISKDPLVRFASLVHDLGKAKTPSKELPSHKGHEKSGLPLIKQLCERLRIPKKYLSLALAVAEYHLHMHKMFELRPETVLKMLEKTKSLNDDIRARQIADCCLADARGRKGFEQREYPQVQLFLDYQQAAKNVNASEIAKNMHDGLKIQTAINRERANAIKKIKPRIE